MADTTSAILSQVLVAEVQSGLLENMRNKLVYGNRAYAEMGTRLGNGSDALRFAAVPDLAVADTPLAEGTPPTAVALTMDSVTVDTKQYGNLVTITDLAKIKSPFDLVGTARERLARNAAESVDQIVRDEIALAGTPIYFGATSRAGLSSSGDTMTAARLRFVQQRMFYGKVQPFDSDGSYLLIVTPGQAHDILTGTASGEFIDVLKYTNSAPILANEIGKISGFRVIKAQNAPTVSNGSITVHLGFALGALPGWGWGDLQSLMTEHTPPGGHGDELRQKESLGWKIDFGVAALNNARYFRLESAASDVTGNSAS